MRTFHTWSAIKMAGLWNKYYGMNRLRDSPEERLRYNWGRCFLPGRAVLCKKGPGGLPGVPLLTILMTPYKK
jgi:hypothetical protein